MNDAANEDGQLTALVIGRPSPDFRSVTVELQGIVRGENVTRVSTLHTALQLEDASFDMIIVLQHWPDEFPSEQAIRLIDRYPLSRLIVCCGPWCDSDGRTRGVWPQAVRVRADRAPQRLRHECDVMQGEKLPLPKTASRDETYSFDSLDSPAVCGRCIRAGVITADPAIHDWVTSALSAMGHVPVSGNDGELLIVDVDPIDAETESRIRMLSEHRPVIALAGFIRSHDEQAQERGGASAVISKLVSVGELSRCIQAVVSPTQIRLSEIRLLDAS